MSLNSYLPECVCLEKNIAEKGFGKSSVKNLRNWDCPCLLCMSYYFLFSKSYKQIVYFFILRNTRTASHRELKLASWSGWLKRSALTCVFFLCPQFSSFSVDAFLSSSVYILTIIKESIYVAQGGQTVSWICESCSRECCKVIHKAEN